MQRSELGANHEMSASLAPDISKIVRLVATWADGRPVVAEVIVYGDRVRAGHPRFTPVELAVRYDERGLVDGFDDWIEQLHSDFAELRATLSQPVRVLTPDHGASWRAIVEGATVAELGIGKVRVLSSPAPQRASAPAARSTNALLATARRWSAQLLGPVAAPRGV